MKLDVINPAGKTAQAVEISEVVFGRAYNEPLIHQTLVACLANVRSGTKGQKNRSATRGGGRKPFAQKGTGRARAGTIRSPIWRGGGRTFAAKPQDHHQKVNKKMYRGAVQSILSELVRQQRLVLIEDLVLEHPKTKQLLEKLKPMNLEEALIITGDWNTNLYLAARNLRKVSVVRAEQINPLNLVKFEKVVVTIGAIRKIEEVLG